METMWSRTVWRVRAKLCVLIGHCLNSEGKYYCVLLMWQSRIEFKYYSIAYFEHITEFDVL